MKSNKNFLTTLFIILILTLVSTIVFFWAQSPLVDYNLQLVAALVIIFLINRKLSSDRFLGQPINLGIFTVAVLVLVSGTGGLASPLFSLTYLLLFGAALLSSTPIVLALNLIIMIFFSSSLTSVNAAVQLFSLLLITPLAIFFGRQYLHLLKQQGEIIFLKKTNEVNEKNLAQQESNALIWLSLNLKIALAEAGEAIGRLLADLSHLTPDQARSLKKIHQQILQLLKESQNIKQVIDEETD